MHWHIIDVDMPPVYQFSWQEIAEALGAFWNHQAAIEYCAELNEERSEYNKSRYYWEIKECDRTECILKGLE
jgi:hypothetical protein